MNGGDDLTPDQAMSEIGRVDRRVRGSARWAGRWFLLVGIVTILYWLIMYFATSPLPEIAAVAWGLFTLASLVYVFRQRVYDRVVWRIQWPVTLAYLVGVLPNMILVGSVRDAHFPWLDGRPAWMAAGAVLLTLVAAAAPLWGAWRLLAGGSRGE